MKSSRNDTLELRDARKCAALSLIFSFAQSIFSSTAISISGADAIFLATEKLACLCPISAACKYDVSRVLSVEYSGILKHLGVVVLRSIAASSGSEAPTAKEAKALKSSMGHLQSVSPADTLFAFEALQSNIQVQYVSSVCP